MFNKKSIWFLVLITVVPLFLTTVITEKGHPLFLTTVITEKGHPVFPPELSGRVWIMQEDKQIRESISVPSAKDTLGEEQVMPAKQMKITIYHWVDNKLQSLSTETDDEGKFIFTIPDCYKAYLITVQKGDKILYSTISYPPHPIQDQDIVLVPTNVGEDNKQRADTSQLPRRLYWPEDFWCTLSKPYASLMLITLSVIWAFLGVSRMIGVLRRRKKSAGNNHVTPSGSVDHTFPDDDTST